MSPLVPEASDDRTRAACGLLTSVLEDYELDVIHRHFWGGYTVTQIGDQIGDGRDRAQRIMRTSYDKMRRRAVQLGVTEMVLDDLATADALRSSEVLT